MTVPPALAWVAGSRTPVKTLITRALNFGTWEEWQALCRSTPRETLLDAVEYPLRGQWTSRGKAFAECIFDRTLPNAVLISYA